MACIAPCRWVAVDVLVQLRVRRMKRLMIKQEIPAGLYLAVAQVLAYVYQIRQYQAGKGKRPDPLKEVPIPPDLRRDE